MTGRMRPTGHGLRTTDIVACYYCMRYHVAFFFIYFLLLYAKFIWGKNLFNAHNLFTFGVSKTFIYYIFLKHTLN